MESEWIILAFLDLMKCESLVFMRVLQISRSNNYSLLSVCLRNPKAYALRFFRSRPRFGLPVALGMDFWSSLAMLFAMSMHCGCQFAMAASSRQ